MYVSMQVSGKMSGAAGDVAWRSTEKRKFYYIGDDNTKKEYGWEEMKELVERATDGMMVRSLAVKLGWCRSGGGGKLGRKD